MKNVRDWLPGHIDFKHMTELFIYQTQLYVNVIYEIEVDNWFILDDMFRESIKDLCK